MYNIAIFVLKTRGHCTHTVRTTMPTPTLMLYDVNFYSLRFYIFPFCLSVSLYVFMDKGIVAWRLE